MKLHTRKLVMDIRCVFGAVWWRWKGLQKTYSNILFAKEPHGIHHYCKVLLSKLWTKIRKFFNMFSTDNSIPISVFYGKLQLLLQLVIRILLISIILSFKTIDPGVMIYLEVLVLLWRHRLIIRKQNLY